MALVVSSFYVSVGFLRHLKKKHEQSQQRHMKFLLPLRPQPGTTEKPQSQLCVCMVFRANSVNTDFLIWQVSVLLTGGGSETCHHRWEGGNAPLTLRLTA